MKEWWAHAEGRKALDQASHILLLNIPAAVVLAQLGHHPVVGHVGCVVTRLHDADVMVGLDNSFKKIRLLKNYDTIFLFQCRYIVCLTRTKQGQNISAYGTMLIQLYYFSWKFLNYTHWTLILFLCRYVVFCMCQTNEIILKGQNLITVEFVISSSRVCNLIQSSL